MNKTNYFNNLINPLWIPREISTNGFTNKKLISMLKKMVEIRLSEKIIAENKKNGFIKGPVHLGIGQEAIAVGVSENLNSKDKVFGGHRSHAHLIALGSSCFKLFAELLSKPSGHSKGMGGSMHLIDKSKGFYGSVPIVSGTVPLAVGSGLACKMQKSKSVALSYFGDGALEEGVVHESLNLASIYKLPVIFILENNLFASHMHISLRQPNLSSTRFAEANNIPFEIVDGNNVVEVSNAAKKAIEKARSGNGPFFIEAITYRWNGHVDWRDDIDVGIKRSEEDLKNWKKRDPIQRLNEKLIKEEIINKNFYSELINKIYKNLKSDWEQALRSPDIKPEKLLSNVYFQEEGNIND